MTQEQAIRLLTTKRAQPSTDYQMAEVYTMAIQSLSQEPTSPCDVCRYNPPSSTDGKPCCMCPAERSAK